eukprot:4544915-Amphidinium_carterae.1
MGLARHITWCSNAPSLLHSAKKPRWGRSEKKSPPACRPLDWVSSFRRNWPRWRSLHQVPPQTPCFSRMGV